MGRSRACIFCQIAMDDEDASIVYQDEHFLVILDLYPLARGHCLVIPKRHVVRLHELSEFERERLFDLAHRVTEAQKACGLGVEGTNILLNDGKAANQTVPHLHLHAIPRKKGDLLTAIPKLALHITGLFGFKTSRKELDQLAQDIAGQMQ